MQDIASWMNRVMGSEVINENQLTKIVGEARRAHGRGGMEAVLDYLLRITQADVDKDSLRSFAEEVQKNPKKGFSMVPPRQRPTGKS